MIPASAHETFRRWLLACASFALLVFVFSPAWSAFRVGTSVPEMGWMIEVRRGLSVLQQMHQPGAEILDPLHRVIQWRLLFPLLGHWLHFSPAILFSCAHFGALLVLRYIVSLVRNQGGDWKTSALLTIALGAGSWFFTSTGWLGYYDSWLALGLLVVAFSPRRWPIWFACLWAPWVDERFVLAAPVALVCRFVSAVYLQDKAVREQTNDSRGESSFPLPARWSVLTDGAVPSVLILAFAVVRLVLLKSQTSDAATVHGYLSGRNFLDAPLPRVLLGIWEGLRGGWLLACVPFLALRSRVLGATLLGFAAVTTAAVGLATAQDYSRSMTMLLPLAVLGATASTRFLMSEPFWSRPLAILAGCSLLLPAHHVMNDQVRPIYYLYHELAAFNNPPPGAMPELYELQAIHAMERGEFKSAEETLGLAIKLSANPASPSRQRGILYASQGRWPEALRDFSTAVAHDSRNPDAWFMRAQGYLATGDVSSARADVNRALSLAPEGWSERADVTRFLAKLNATRP